MWLLNVWWLNKILYQITFSLPPYIYCNHTAVTISFSLHLGITFSLPPYIYCNHTAISFLFPPSWHNIFSSYLYLLQSYGNNSFFFLPSWHNIFSSYLWLSQSYVAITVIFSLHLGIVWVADLHCYHEHHTFYHRDAWGHRAAWSIKHYIRLKSALAWGEWRHKTHLWHRQPTVCAANNCSGIPRGPR